MFSIWETKDLRSYATCLWSQHSVEETAVFQTQLSDSKAYAPLQNGDGAWDEEEGSEPVTIITESEGRPTMRAVRKGKMKVSPQRKGSLLSTQDGQCTRGVGG